MWTESTSPKQQVTTAPKDLPYGEDPIAIRWRRRGGGAGSSDVRGRSFTESIPEVPPGAAATDRLRRRAPSGRRRPQRRRGRLRARPVLAAIDQRAAERLSEPEPTRWWASTSPVRRAPLAVHPPRRRRRTWQRVDQWETGFVDLTGAQGTVGAGQRPSLIRDYRLAQPAQ